MTDCYLAVAVALEKDGELRNCSDRILATVAGTLSTYFDKRRSKSRASFFDMLDSYRTTSAPGACGCVMSDRSPCQHELLGMGNEVRRQWYSRKARANPHSLGPVGNFAADPFTFTDRCLAAKAVLGALGETARTADSNVACRSFNHTPMKGGKKSDGRAIADGFDKWLLAKLLPSVRTEALDAANVVLAGMFAGRGFDVVLTGLPRFLGVRQMSDTELCFRVTPAVGRPVRFAEPVNVKYIATGTAKANTHGTDAFAHLMLGSGSKAGTNSDTLWADINDSLRLSPRKNYHVPDSNYWFWSFTRDVDAAPVCDQVAVSMLLSSELDSPVRESTVTVNKAQAAPGIQYDFRRAAAFQRQPISCLEGRDRLWQYVQPERQAIAIAALEALRGGF